MCRRVTCRKCGKPSWAGCGAHVEHVLADVPRAQRCKCHEAPAKVAAKSKVKAAAAPPPTTAFGRFKDWLKQ
ncbi:MAG: hypothetical protein R2694_19235 [Ilumatobacteraceae bacterium]